MAKISAGILLYRKAASGFEVLLVHPGGPFWAKKDKGSWSIPKGECDEGEAMLPAAKREFSEETGKPAPDGEYTALESAKVSSSKTVHAFALEADLDISGFKSNTFEMEWPPKSGQMQSFPETDKAAWVPLAQATAKVVKGQVPIIEQLASILGVDVAEVGSGPEDNQATLF